jgi:transposase-like protein
VFKSEDKMKNGYQIKQQRFFSEGLRREIVGQIERGEFNVAQVMREYQVAKQTVYNWLYKYSSNLKKGTRMVMEKDSQERSTQELRNRIKELEAALGRKSLEADLYRLIVEKASDEYRVDLKKSFGDRLSGPHQK